MLRKKKLGQLALKASLVCCLFSPLSAQPLFPSAGREAVYQKALDAQNRLHVLSISLQPGFEDLEALAYFRLGRGARITSVYVTNGESVESDLGDLYPQQIAAERREEAVKALNAIEGEAFFLNLPDIAAARNPKEVLDSWGPDSLRSKLMSAISSFRPDIILLARDWESDTMSARLTALQSELVQAIERIAVPQPNSRKLPGGAYPRWTVRRAVVQSQNGKGIIIPVNGLHPYWKKTFASFGQEAASHYSSLKVHWNQWRSDRKVAYLPLFPKNEKNLRSVDQGVPAPLPLRLKPVGQSVQVVVAGALQWAKAGRFRERPSILLKQLAKSMEGIDAQLGRWSALESTEFKVLLRWKESLESLRSALLGVEVRYSIDYHVLTDKQLVNLTIDSVLGLSGGGETEVFFPAVPTEWILNESNQNRIPLALHEQLRLICMNAQPYDLPHWLNGLANSTFGRSFDFFILHKAKNREESFFYRTKIPMEYAPRFSVEVLTPIVRIVPNERLVVRLTNNSRDGVRDEVHVNDSLVVSSAGKFRLNNKGQSFVDTLILNWKKPMGENTYLFPVKIGETKVAQFTARGFALNIDSTRRIGIVPSNPASTLVNAVRQMGILSRPVDLDGSLKEQLDSIDVLIIDRRALSLRPGLSEVQNQTMEMFVRNGGYLLIMAQDAGAWNAHPLIPDLRFRRSQAYTPGNPLRFDSLHAVFNRPNRLEKQDWDDWLFRRSYNTLSGESLLQADVVVRDAPSGNPQLATWRIGKGRRTYVDLDLDHQLMNLHPGVFRLLANIFAW